MTFWKQISQAFPPLFLSHFFFFLLLLLLFFFLPLFYFAPHSLIRTPGTGYKNWYLCIREILVVTCNHVTVRQSAPQAYQCKITQSIGTSTQNLGFAKKFNSNNDVKVTSLCQSRVIPRCWKWQVTYIILVILVALSWAVLGTEGAGRSEAPPVAGSKHKVRPEKG